MVVGGAVSSDYYVRALSVDGLQMVERKKSSPLRGPSYPVHKVEVPARGPCPDPSI